MDQVFYRRILSGHSPLLSAAGAYIFSIAFNTHIIALRLMLPKMTVAWKLSTVNTCQGVLKKYTNSLWSSSGTLNRALNVSISKYILNNAQPGFSKYSRITVWQSSFQSESLIEGSIVRSITYCTWNNALNIILVKYNFNNHLWELWEKNRIIN